MRNMKQTWTAAELMKRWGASRATAYRIVKSKEFPRPVNVVGPLKYDRKAVEDWERSRRRK